MTFNVRHGVGMDRRLDLHRQATIISQADIVLLQEVDRHLFRSRRQDQAQVLAEGSGLYNYAFGASLNFLGGQYGNAVLSRFPLRSVAVHRIPRPFWTEPRTVLQVETTIDDEVVYLFNTHLGYTFEQRREGIQVILGLVQRARGRVLFGGDLNVGTKSAETAALGAALQEVSSNCGPTYPSSHPLRQIDHLFVRGATGLKSCQVIETQASDHRPVLAVIGW